MKSFFIHLSMTLKYTLNPKFWFMTEAYKLRQENRPQTIKKNDIAMMIKELQELGHISDQKAKYMWQSISELSDIDLKKIYIRSLESQDLKNQYNDKKELCEESSTRHIQQAIDSFINYYKKTPLQ